MTSVEIVLMILRYLMALALVIIAFILIRRTFSKNKSESNRELRGGGVKVVLGFCAGYGMMSMFDHLIDYIFS